MEDSLNIQGIIEDSGLSLISSLGFDLKDMTAVPWQLIASDKIQIGEDAFCIILKPNKCDGVLAFAVLVAPVDANDKLLDPFLALLSVGNMQAGGYVGLVQERGLEEGGFDTSELARLVKDFQQFEECALYLDDDPFQAAIDMCNTEGLILVECGMPDGEVVPYLECEWGFEGDDVVIEAVDQITYPVRSEPIEAGDYILIIDKESKVVILLSKEYKIE